MHREIDLIEQLKNGASPQSQKAMRKLEERGLRFLVHFGTDNAVDRLRAMNHAFKWGYLDEHMRHEYGL